MVLAVNIFDDITPVQFNTHTFLLERIDCTFHINKKKKYIIALLINFARKAGFPMRAY